MVMAAGPAVQVASRRMVMTAIGALAGLAAWFLVEVLPQQPLGDRLQLFVTAAAGGFFAGLLAISGALPLARAALTAAAAALPAALLLTWASLRYAEVEAFLNAGHGPAAFALIVALSLPFGVVAQRPGEGWRSYPALFRQSWDIAVRYAAAWIFVGAFWAVLFLSDALFSLVGLDVIQRLIDIGWVPPVLTGAVLGMALAVVAELADYISPFLILRLLRLLLPVVLVVTAVFLAALPLRGLSELFGGLSAAAVLLAMALGIATLIAATIDREDAEAAGSKVLRLSARFLALALPLLTGLALYAVLIRTADYGWTPDRIAAACSATIGMGYGVLYTLAVLRRSGWMERIRQANIAMALAVLGLAVLWLTPLLNAERLSARDQLVRIASGEVSAEEADLWFLGRELGRPGEAALAELAEGAGEAMAERLALLERADDRFDFEEAGPRPEGPAEGEDPRETILARATVQPEGRTLTAELLAGAYLGDLRAWSEACAETTAAGNPGCAVVFADLVPGTAGEEALIFWLSAGGVAVAPADGGLAVPRFARGSPASLTPEVLDRLAAGAFTLAPARLQALDLGAAEILLLP
jgi:hypothetical protein